MAKTVCENTDYTAFARRIIRAHGRRVAQGDPVDLAELVELRADMDQVIRQAVVGMRERHGYSWADIGRELGITRQAAQQQYGRAL
jgi:uncharacterized protein with PIN domain